jgi:hypothetical protein
VLASEVGGAPDFRFAAGFSTKFNPPPFSPAPAMLVLYIEVPYLSKNNGDLFPLFPINSAPLCPRKTPFSRKTPSITLSCVPTLLVSPGVEALILSKSNKSSALICCDFGFLLKKRSQKTLKKMGF